MEKLINSYNIKIYNSFGTLTNNTEVWNIKFEELKQYIDINLKLPSDIDADKKIKNIKVWLNHQRHCYKRKIRIMTNVDIYDIWYKFINDDKYKKYFLSYKENWIKNFKEVKQYIDINNKRPSSTDNDKHVKSMGFWILLQIQNYSLKTKIMTDIDIYEIWKNFINDNKYKEYFLDRTTVWFNTFNEVKKYIDTNGKRPSKQSKDKDTKSLGLWISNQTNKYKIKSEIMKNDHIYDEWTNFITSDKYKEHFLSFEEEWINMLNIVTKYLDDNGKRPPPNSIDPTVKKLERWIGFQINKYKHKTDIMKIDYYYKIWTKFMNANSQHFKRLLEK